MDKSVTVSPEVARHVLFAVWGDLGLGVQPGGWEADLIRLIQHADEGNRARIAAGFPEHVAAIPAGRSPWVLDWLRETARRDVFGDDAARLMGSVDRTFTLLGGAL